METYIEPRELVKNPLYREQRQASLANLTDNMIDAPIQGLIKLINQLSYCFTLQSCFGHFLYVGQDDPYNVAPLPLRGEIDRVEYRIAYIALCIENSELGSKLKTALNELTDIDPKNIQFCSAGWFWERQVNSYALQVEPDRYKHQDKAILSYKEALFLEKLRNKFFSRTEKLFGKLQSMSEACN